MNKLLVNVTRTFKMNKRGFNPFSLLLIEPFPFFQVLLKKLPQYHQLNQTQTRQIRKLLSL